MFIDDMDAMDEIKREDIEEENGEDQQKILTHNYEDYYKDNFKNEKGEMIGEKPEAEEDEEKNEADGKVQIDENAFAGEDDLGDLPDDL